MYNSNSLNKFVNFNNFIDTTDDGYCRYVNSGGRGKGRSVIYFEIITYLNKGRKNLCICVKVF